MAREGRPVRHLDRRLNGQLIAPQAGDLGAPAAAGGEGDHQDGAVAQIAQVIGRAGRQQLCEDFAGDRLGALATSLSWRGSDRQPNGLFFRKGCHLRRFVGIRRMIQILG